MLFLNMVRVVGASAEEKGPDGGFVLEGHITFQVGGQELKAGPGTFASIPKQTEHSFTIDVVGTRLLNFYVPGGFEMFIMSLAVPAQERKSPEPGTTPMPSRWMAMEASHEFGQIAAPTMPIADPPTDENRATKPSENNANLPYGVCLEHAPAFWAEGCLFSLLASREQTGGSYSLLHQRCPKDAGPAPHTHDQDEGIYVLAGDLTVIAGGEQYTAHSGSFVYVPEGTVHSFRVDSAEAELLNWYLPGGFEESVTKAASTGRRELPPVGVDSTITAVQQKALFEQVGMTLVALPDVLRTGTRMLT